MDSRSVSSAPRVVVSFELVIEEQSPWQEIEGGLADQIGMPPRSMVAWPGRVMTGEHLEEGALVGVRLKAIRRWRGGLGWSEVCRTETCQVTGSPEDEVEVDLDGCEAGTLVVRGVVLAEQ